jgi:hypothetical protein
VQFAFGVKEPEELHIDEEALKAAKLTQKQAIDLRRRMLLDEIKKGEG